MFHHKWRQRQKQTQQLLTGGSIDTVTRMEPEEPFWGDELTYFASYVQPDYALELPSMEQISGWYPCVAQHAQDTCVGLGWGIIRLLAQRDMIYFDRDKISHEFARPIPQEVCADDANLFSREFCRDAGPKSLDLAGLTMLERFEKCMRLLHPERACDWWSWFRISGVTKTVLDRYDHDDAARQRIWDAHCEWSSNYPSFSEEENFQVILQASLVGGVRV
ncbi:unnamed protein product [Symbiodinium natans]|uniref:Uncharacterized protein n=1 Tax=Symbiodinium natans TaxID=878477 RepID=A0A812LPX2_9DINO|nr:unnamed protein product [Symbiodinium natans]